MDTSTSNVISQVLAVEEVAQVLEAKKALENIVESAEVTEVVDTLKDIAADGKIDAGEVIEAMGAVQEKVEAVTEAVDDLLETKTGAKIKALLVKLCGCKKPATKYQ